ncbi:YqaE/Pmp3 family membrane protein [Sphingomonas sp.]|uniref:YqaE/Pmp3 family membrane protein n=1 Tax=Sphingomonas sp. TaxID=28214 RepID=UPI003B3B0B6F
MSDGEPVGIGTILAAVLLPPLGVFAVRGIDTLFWISVVLTIIGWVPGIVFALVVILRPDLLSRIA